MSFEVNRRGFLTAAGLAGFSSPGRAHAEEKAGAVRLGVASYSFREFNRELAIKCIKELRTPWVSVKEVAAPSPSVACGCEISTGLVARTTSCKSQSGAFRVGALAASTQPLVSTVTKTRGCN